MYYLIRETEDGLDINELTKEELLRRITPDENGITYYGRDILFMNKLPRTIKGGFDPYSEWNRIVVIKGEIVKPVPINQVIKYEVD